MPRAEATARHLAPQLATPPDPGTAAPRAGSGIARPAGASPSQEALMESMKKNRRCPNTGLSVPECSCRRCCVELLRRYAPEPDATLARGGRKARR
jgi:hypothetical protein